jgi:WhiB family transcriptional regulator, redox-sensing transcriptional regulator
MVMTDPLAWMDEGLCRGLTTEIFFPEDFALPDPAVKRLCRRCPVREACLQYALDHEEVGIWGGTDDEQRAKILRERHRVKCPGCLSLEVRAWDRHEICLSCGLSWPI